MGWLGRNATLLVCAVLVAASGCGTERAYTAPSAPTASASPTEQGPEPKLVGTEWQLAEYTRNGSTTAVPEEMDSVLRFDGKGHYSGRACNWFGGDTTIADARFEIYARAGTDAGCDVLRGQVEDAVLGTLQGWLAWSIQRQRLMVRAPNGDTLIYRVRDSIYPNRSARAIIVGERGGVPYRVAVTDQRGLVVESRNGPPGTAWGDTGLAIDPIVLTPRLEIILWRQVGDAYIVAGVVPGSVVKVIHRDPATKAGTELDIYPVNGTSRQVFAGFVPTHSRDSTVTAYDADGEFVTGSLNR
jgi:heat shock protein HslJ